MLQAPMGAAAVKPADPSLASASRLHDHCNHHHNQADEDQHQHNPRDDPKDAPLRRSPNLVTVGLIAHMIGLLTMGIML